MSSPTLVIALLTSLSSIKDGLCLLYNCLCSGTAGFCCVSFLFCFFVVVFCLFFVCLSFYLCLRTPQLSYEAVDLGLNLMLTGYFTTELLLHNVYVTRISNFSVTSGLETVCIYLTSQTPHSLLCSTSRTSMMAIFFQLVLQLITTIGTIFGLYII